MDWFKKKVSPENGTSSEVVVPSDEVAVTKKGGYFSGRSKTPKSADSISSDKGSSSLISLETFKTKPVNPKRMKACHMSFQKWFTVEKKYCLTRAQFDSLEREIPGYSAALEHIVRNNLDVDEAFSLLERIVDPIFDPEVRAKQWLETEHWPGVWIDWKEYIEMQNRARIVTSCIQREVARRRAQRALADARIEAESMAVKPVDESALARAREIARRKVCLMMAMQLSREGIRLVRIPGMAIRVQSVERGNRVRRRMERYKAWLVRRRIWMLEQSRAKAGLIYMRDVIKKDPTKLTFEPDVERRIWGREGYDGGEGVDMSESYALLDYIDKAPEGRDHGVRTHKVKIPLQTPYQEKLALEDSNTWVGIPVSMKEVDTSKRAAIGPEMRTTSEFESAHLDRSVGDKTKFVTSYSWIPAKLVRDAIVDLKETEETVTEEQELVSELDDEGFSRGI